MSSVITRLTLGLLAISISTVALGPPVVDLGTAADFAILARTGVSTVPPSNITGDIGVTPVADTFLTGFSLTLDPSGKFSTSTQVHGKLFAASNTAPTPSTLVTAVSSVISAYTDATSRQDPDFTEINGGVIGGLTLNPGLYNWTNAVSIATDVTLSGSASDTWIFQISGAFTISPGIHVVLADGALAENIVWASAGSVTFGPGAHLEGVLLGKSGVTLQTGSTVNGRVLAQTFVTLQQTTIDTTT